MNRPLPVHPSVHARPSRASSSSSPRVVALLVGALAVVACSGGGGSPSNLATNADGGAPSPNPTKSCTTTTSSCTDGALTSCEDGITKTTPCSEWCEPNGYGAGNSCTDNGKRCACGDPTDTTCYNGVVATCTCIDGAKACATGESQLALYEYCHREAASETASILKCFAKYKSGDQVACNSAVTSCGDSAPSSGCTADADCAHCERCERSTGKCLTKAACE